ncbi:hypothetical protein NDU88_001632 [Pleurodeles waltl]|uniref:Uncharacterized protein n=1 Tax=Pleurodeles waltl TaxID=8319 RepID=A0AAV7VCG3_PLEWA|nr:hypothetical protein NDU88_001632 [Pleurodeles waltl]
MCVTGSPYPRIEKPFGPPNLCPGGTVEYFKQEIDQPEIGLKETERGETNSKESGRARGETSSKESGGARGETSSKERGGARGEMSSKEIRGARGETSSKESGGARETSSKESGGVRGEPNSKESGGAREETSSKESGRARGEMCSKESGGAREETNEVRRETELLAEKHDELTALGENANRPSHIPRGTWLSQGRTRIPGTWGYWWA